MNVLRAWSSRDAYPGPYGEGYGSGMDGSGRDLDAVMGRVAAELLARSHHLPPGAIAQLFTEVAAPLGVSAVRVYLADLQQQNLRLMPPGSGLGAPEVLPVGSTAAGQAYRETRAQESSADPAGARRLWLPLLDGSERLGVLELAVQDAAGGLAGRYQMLASLAGLMIASKSIYSDTYARAMRTQEMALQGELVWAFTASRTFVTDRVLVAAALEPACDVGGDAFDYSLLGDRLHVSIFDAVGHDLTSGLLTSAAMAACRSTRRAGRRYGRSQPALTTPSPGSSKTTGSSPRCCATSTYPPGGSPVSTAATPRRCCSAAAK
jgi:hypothetical protein